MPSTNLAERGKLSEILQGWDLAKRILCLAGWVTAESTTLRCISPGHSGAGQLGPAQEETTKNAINAAKPDGNLEKESETNPEDLHFFLFHARFVHIPLCAYFSSYVCEEKRNSPADWHTTGQQVLFTTARTKPSQMWASITWESTAPASE